MSTYPWPLCANLAHIMERKEKSMFFGEKKEKEKAKIMRKG